MGFWDPGLILKFVQLADVIVHPISAEELKENLTTR
jgi:hypothetical protein